MTPNKTAAKMDLSQGLELGTFTDWLLEIENQPAWRAKADREMEYVDGNQLDSEVLQRQKALGMPPAIEPLIGPAVDAVLGFEAKTRTDWRITPDGDRDGDDVAEALNYKLNQAERHSGADRAMGDAFKHQLCVGLGWVEVARESDPFKYPYRCKTVHRNEIFWDWLSVEPDLSDARYLLRRRWTDADQVMLKFPEHAELIGRCVGRWSDYEVTPDGGTSTDLAMAWDQERGWSIEEMQWRDSERGRVCLYEMWYRRWERVTVIKTPDGRVVEYDEASEAHNYALASGMTKPMQATVGKVFVSYWMGPHKLYDGPSPYQHHHFPYVPFWGKREDRTMAPYGVVRGMVYLQDNINSAISKIRWGLSAVRTIRTQGAVAYPDEIFRQQVSRVDADIVLNAEHMAQQGAMFKVERDFQLNEQQYKMLQDARLGIERASGITAGFQGKQGTATSGLQESTQIEQTTQALADLMDNFKEARTQVGELLMALVIEDIGERQEPVLIRGDAVKPDKTVVLNQPEVDPVTGLQYRTNDVQRTRLKVALQDVPSTPSFRTQQLGAMSEVAKSVPPDVQQVLLPYLLQLMDLPNRDEIIEAIREAKGQQSPEQIQQQIDQAVREKGIQVKERELDLKYSPERQQAEIRKIVAETVESGLRAAFAAMQGAQVVASMPQVAPVADVLMQNAGWTPPTPAGQDPNIPAPQGLPAPVVDMAAGDTSPNTPAAPMEPGSPMEGQNRGIETMRADSELA